MDEELKLKLTTEFGGMDDATQYAEALNNVAKAESNLARASRRAAKVLTESAKVKQDAIKIGGAVPPPTNYRLSKNDVMGPHTRLGLLQEKLKEASASGADPAAVADIKLKIRRNQRQIDRSGENVGGQDYEAVGQALLSSRFNAGPLQPLVGRTMRAAITPERAKAIGGLVESGVSKIPGASKVPGVAGLGTAIGGLGGSNAAAIIGRLATGPVGMAIGGIILAGKALKFLAEKTEEVIQEEERKAQMGVDANNRMLAQGAAFGSGSASHGDVYSSLFGKDVGGAAFAFQNKIASDPYARSSAARLGISDLGGNFGSIDPGKKYIEAIKKLSSAEDELSRRRMSRALGIEEEVEKYRLLSDASKKNIEYQAELQKVIMNPAQQKRSAEYERSVERLKKVEELQDVQDGKVGENMLTWWNNTKSNFKEFWLKDSANSTILKTLAGDGGTTGQPGKSETQANTEATEKLNQTMMRLNKNIGETAQSRDAFGKLQGGNLFDAWQVGALRAGAL